MTVRDLARDPLPHIDQDFITATRSAEGAQTPKQRAMLTHSDALVDELLKADIVVIAAAMINFSVASTLKTWFDYVARAGRTFSYSEAGAKGLATGKRVIVVAATGGVYAGDSAAFDFQVPWLKTVLGFLGMTDVEVIKVEGTAYGPDAADKAIAHATTCATCRRGRARRGLTPLPTRHREFSEAIRKATLSWIASSLRSSQ